MYTIDMLLAAEACYSAGRMREIAGGRTSMTLLEIMELPISMWDKIWVASTMEWDGKDQWMQYVLERTQGDLSAEVFDYFKEKKTEYYYLLAHWNKCIPAFEISFIKQAHRGYTVEDILSYDPCYKRPALEAMLAGRSALTLPQIFQLPINLWDRLWVACKVAWPLKSQWIDSLAITEEERHIGLFSLLCFRAHHGTGWVAMFKNAAQYVGATVTIETLSDPEFAHLIIECTSYNPLVREHLQVCPFKWADVPALTCPDAEALTTEIKRRIVSSQNDRT